MCFLSIFPLAGLLIIILLIGVKVFLLKRKGISFKPEKSKKPGVNLLLYPVFILIVLIWLAGLIGHVFNWHPLLYTSILTKPIVLSPVLAFAGAVIILLSVVLMAITLLHFKTALRFGLNSNNQGKLITEGIFAYSRNPFFLSLDLYFIGQALVIPGILFIAMALLAVTGIHLFILKEEKFLSLHYGNAYTLYMHKVGRYF